MLDLRTALLLPVLLAASPDLRQDPAPRSADELYPARRCDQVVRYLTVKTDEPELGPLGEALGELGAKVIYGPRTTGARPGHAFFAVSAPWEVSAKQLERAARKSGGKARELTCTAFEGREGRDQAISVGGLGFTSRDFVMGISGDIVWFDSIGDRSQFYGLPGKLEPKELLARYEKLCAPYGGGTLGRVVRERFTWTLSAVPDEKVGAKLVKAAGKLTGVLAVGLDGASLTVDVELADLELAAPAATLGAAADGQEFDEAGMGTPQAVWCSRPLWDLHASFELQPGS